jgi:GTPase SAR1 family protein
MNGLRVPALSVPALGGFRGSALVCPYCYNTFDERTIEFRCTGRPGPRGKTCDVQRDEHQARLLNFVTPLPPVFPGDGRQLRAVCPQCGEQTPHRVCPHCHSRLPLRYGKVDSRLIAMIGASQSGKTVFMTVLMHELMHRLGGILDAACLGSDDETLKSFNDYDHGLYDQHELPRRTEPVAAPSQRHPLVFRLAMTRRRLLRPRREQHTILSFFDTAGEDLTSRESIELNVRYLTNSHAIIMLLDPLQMPGARSQALSSAILPESGAARFDTAANVLGRVTDLLGVAQDGANGTIRKPVAVVLSKLDALEHTLAAGSPLTQLPAARPEFDERDSTAVHLQAQALLDEWDGPQIDRHMRHFFARYRYFGVSALGCLPADPATVSAVRPYRVHDPFLWLLSEFGAIPVKRG